MIIHNTWLHSLILITIITNNPTSVSIQHLFSMSFLFLPFFFLYILFIKRFSLNEIPNQEIVSFEFGHQLLPNSVISDAASVNKSTTNVKKTEKKKPLINPVTMINANQKEETEKEINIKTRVPVETEKPGMREFFEEKKKSSTRYNKWDYLYNPDNLPEFDNTIPIEDTIERDPSFSDRDSLYSFVSRIAINHVVMTTITDSGYLDLFYTFYYNSQMERYPNFFVTALDKKAYDVSVCSYNQ